MGLFSFKKKGFVEWGDHCDRNREKLANIKDQMEAIEDSKLGAKSQIPKYSSGLVSRSSNSLVSSALGRSSSSSSSSSSYGSAPSAESESAAPFPFLAGFNSGVNEVSSITANPSSLSSSTNFSSNPLSSSSSSGSSLDADEKKRRLANRLMQMTTQIEELSNNLYQLQQKMELMERKIAARGL